MYEFSMRYVHENHAIMIRKEEIPMKRSYESMEAYKVAFNADEQVAAACDAYDSGSKYQIPILSQSVCDMSADNSKYTGMGYSTCFFTDAGSDAMGIAVKYQA